MKILKLLFIRILWTFGLWNHTRLDFCPNCYRRFSDWFIWPGYGRYCWPCYTDKHILYSEHYDQILKDEIV